MVDEYRALDTNQIWLMMFPKTEYGLRSCQRHLQRLTKNKRISRRRYAPNQPYAYYQKARGQLEHVLEMNWVRIWLERTLKSWESIFVWQYEPEYDVIRPDGICAIENTVTGEKRFYFVELDRSHKAITEIKKYNKHYENLVDEWWMRHTKRFPHIVIVTERPESFQREVMRHNRNGLMFIIKTLAEVKKEAGLWV